MVTWRGEGATIWIQRRKPSTTTALGFGRSRSYLSPDRNDSCPGLLGIVMCGEGSGPTHVDDGNRNSKFSPGTTAKGLATRGCNSGREVRPMGDLLGKMLGRIRRKLWISEQSKSFLEDSCGTA